MYNNILKNIKEFDNITIFRHHKPDGDATFAAFALKEYIKSNFKNKKVKCAGNESFGLFPKTEKVSNKFIENSLAIILDVSTINRIDDDRFINAKKIIVIDHHPNIPDFTDDYYVETQCSATCELLAKIFYSKEFSKLNINKKVCEYLCSGILTDSLSFSTTNTTDKTLFYASKLIADGMFKISDLNVYLFNKDIKSFEKVTKLRNYLKVKNGVGYIILNENDLNNLDMTYDEAKNNIAEFGAINELKIWAIFAYNKKTNSFDGSIRSKKDYVINDLCSKFNGGGHKNACGVKNLSEKDLNKFINECIKICNKK